LGKGCTPQAILTRLGFDLDDDKADPVRGGADDLKILDFHAHVHLTFEKIDHLFNILDEITLH